MIELAFLLVTLLAVLFFYLGTGRDMRVLVVSFLWIFGISAISATGFFQNTEATPPRILLVLIGAIALAIFLFKRIDKSRINNKLLILLHSIRIPVEVALFQLFLNGDIPQIMTFQGWNYDIFIGISAVIVFAYTAISKKELTDKFLLFWNMIGILSLTVIVITALLSAPSPIQLFAFDQPNVAVQKFPFILLPAYIVPIVYTSHFLSFVKARNLAKQE
jgi:hypothetical protein